MLKVTLGFTTGAILGAGATLFAGLLTIVALEDSPKLLNALVESGKNQTKLRQP